MKTDIKTITINGVEYVEKSTINTTAPAYRDGLPYVIIRTYSAGVHAGYLKSRNGKEVTLIDSRRLWQWYGAASLSQLAMEGVNRPKECKFGMTLPSIELTEAIEIIPATESARNSIEKVEVWKV